MLNWGVRYAPVVGLLKTLEVRSILDVGSGSHGVSRFLQGPLIIQTDLDVDRPAAGCHVVRADALRMPFGAGSFDAVMSLDLLEHLSVGARVAALNEMFRLARDCVVIGFPVAPGAQQADEELADHLGRRRRPLPPWLLEHRENPYPTVELGQSHPAGWALAQRWDNDPLWLHVPIARLEHHRVLGRLSSLPVPLRISGAISGLKGARYYRSIFVFRRVSVDAARA